MIVNGSDLMLFISKEGKTDPHSIGGATSHTLTINQSLNQLATKDNGGGRWAQNYPGLMDWTIDAENFTINMESVGDAESFSENKRVGFGFNDLFDLMISRKPIWCVFALEGNSPDFYNEKIMSVGDEKTKNGWTPGTGQFQGWGYIANLTQNAPTGEFSSYSLQIVGHGELKRIEASDDKSDASNYSLGGGSAVVTTAKTAKTATAEK